MELEKKFFEIRNHFLKLLPFWLAGAITALVATSYAKVFAWAEHLSLQIYERTGLWYLLIPPVFFVASWLLVEFFSSRANGSGIPQLMVAIELSQNKKYESVPSLLSLRIIIVKILSSLLGVLGGGAIGREGPTLQISGSIFQIFNTRWKLSEIQNRSAFLMAGAASGLASAFNTPLGGIVYVVEELAKSHLSSFRTGVLHAVIVAGIISQMIMGPYLYFGYPKIDSFKLVTIPYYLLVALSAAVIVTLFSEALKTIVIFRSRIVSFRGKLILTALCGFFFALITIYVSVNTMGPGKELLNRLLFSSQSAQFTDVIVRFFGTLLTYANGGAGGIFAPTLTLGGTAAGAFNSLLQFDLGPLAILIGMTAGLSALTHSPLTSFILILEMTDRQSAIFPLMLAAIIGHGFSKLVSKQAFYEFVCERITSNAKEIY